MTTPEQVAEAQRDLGRQLAAWRKAAGLTQAGFGPRIGYSRSAVANIETGREQAPQSFWEAADRGLSAGGALLAGYRQVAELERRYKTGLARARERQRTARMAGLLPPTDEQPGNAASIPASGSGRMSLPMPDAFVCEPSEAGMIDGETVTLTVVSDGPARAFRVSRRALLELTAGAVTTSASAVLGVAVPRTVDPAVVSHFAALRALLVRADNRLGGLSILSTVQQQIAIIAELRRKARGGLRDQLLSTEASWYEFGGWLNDDLGNREAGARLLDRAVSMAQEADDRELCAYVLARKAQRAIGTDDEDRVIGLGRAAARTSGAPAQVRAFAAVVYARGNAIDGDRHGFQAALHQARCLVEQGSTDGDAFGSFCTSAYLSANEGEGWLRLNDPRRAIASLTAAIREWPAGYQRERGRYLARTAHAYLAAAEPDQAATVGAAALALADRTGSARIRQEISALGSHLGAFRARPAVKDLLDQLAARP
ncbi:helix-turn-helix transcriptional regulator [Plantactinospora sp. ZYX-F-223]|uniref:helix-turn-helix domain-containing protein n=1 Tax=Plantactinospora sp. ZYX-F-223 TaxID=3144103 RepID=UPI0031FD402A